MERLQKTVSWFKGTAQQIGQFLSGTEPFLTSSLVGELSPVWSAFPLSTGLTVPNPNHGRERSKTERERTSLPTAIATPTAPAPEAVPFTQSPAQFPTETATPASPSPAQGRSRLFPVSDCDGQSDGAKPSVSRWPLIETHSSPTSPSDFSGERPLAASETAAEAPRSHARSQSQLAIVPEAFPIAVDLSETSEALLEVVPVAVDSAERSQAEITPFPQPFPTEAEARSQSPRPLPPPPWELHKPLQTPESFPTTKTTERSPFPTSMTQGTVGNADSIRVFADYPHDLSPRTREVYRLLDEATARGLQSYSQLMTWVETQSGQRCSRRFIAAWKQLKKVA
ncbi:hypothetical protein DOP62_14065 (plasmid) [Synechococcus elongatus PCC 11801]|uniref:Uncharacterized protein n=1 Tax=Synechococcus elongatus PCC 11801 TaxID=2219813 RepID=A0ACD5A3C9_SYNEL